MNKRFIDILIVVFIFVCISLAFANHSEAAWNPTLKFSWTVVPDEVAKYGTIELRVYQDSFSNPPASADPLSGIIEVQPTIEGCSNFFATYATATEESERTEAIKVCEPLTGDPDPAERILSVGGFKMTIEIQP